MKWRGTAQLSWEFDALDRRTAVLYLRDLLDRIEAGSDDDYAGHFDFRLSPITDEQKKSDGNSTEV